MINTIIINPEDDERPHAEISILGKKVRGLLDSGASCSLFGGSAVNIIEELRLRKGEARGQIKTVDGTAHNIRNFVYLPIAFNNQIQTIAVLLAPSLPECVVLGMNFWNTFGVKPVCFALKEADVEIIEPSEVVESTVEEPMKELTPQQKEALDRVIATFPTAKEGKLGRTRLYEHRIDVGEAKPKKQRHYPMSKYVLDEVNKEIDRMLALDVIEEAMFSPWNNPLVAVRKKNGSCRVCLDARHLNSIMTNEGYPIPQTSAIINNLGGCAYISSIDLKDAFWQLPLEEASRPMTAFTVPSRGHFQFKVVPFGLCTASQALSRLMTHLFADLEPQVFHYLDDIIICSRSFDEYLAMLAEVADGCGVRT